MGEALFLNISGSDLYDILLEFDLNLEKVVHIRSIGGLRSIPPHDLSLLIEDIEALLYKIYTRLRVEIKSASEIVESSKLRMKKDLFLEKRKALIDFCLRSSESPDISNIQNLTSAFIEDVASLEFNINKIGDIESSIKALTKNIDSSDDLNMSAGDGGSSGVKSFLMSDLEKNIQLKKKSADQISLLNYRLFYMEKVCLKKLIKFRISNSSSLLIRDYEVDRSGLGVLNSKYSSFLSLLSLVSLLRRGVDRGLYFPLFKDFRGRTYSYCPAHPIYNRLVRPFLEFNAKLDNLSLINSGYFKLLSSLTLDPKFIGEIELIYIKSRSSLTFEVFKYFIILFSLEIFKFHKGSYVDLFKNGSLGLEWISYEGFKLRDTGVVVFDKIDEKFYYNKVLRGLKGFISSGEVSNMTITRDSTASFIQH